MVAGRRQHVVSYEFGAASLNAGIQFIAVDDEDGMVDADNVRGRGRPPNTINPRWRWSASRTRTWPRRAPRGRWTGCARVVHAAGPVPVHMDGARLFNAEAATGIAAAEWAAPATTVMCCLSKGLCAPVGSLLAGNEDVIAEARLARKRLGGGMRQAGVLAAPGLLALRDMVARLPEDHARAARLADAVADAGPAAVSTRPPSGPTS